MVRTSRMQGFFQAQFYWVRPPKGSYYIHHGHVLDAGSPRTVREISQYAAHDDLDGIKTTDEYGCPFRVVATWFARPRPRDAYDKFAYGTWFLVGRKVHFFRGGKPGAKDEFASVCGRYDRVRRGARASEAGIAVRPTGEGLCLACFIRTFGDRPNGWCFPCHRNVHDERCAPNCRDPKRGCHRDPEALKRARRRAERWD